MPNSTITLENSLEWCKRFVFNRQLAIGNPKEPFLTSANLTMQTILGPPFRWRWNRLNVSFTTVPGQQDYNQTTGLSWIETASVQDVNVIIPKWYEMSPKINLGLDSSPGRPQQISSQFDQGGGSQTLRLMPVPEQGYPVTVTGQQAATLLTSLNQTWFPLPDYYSYIYNTGVLAWMFLFADDARYGVMSQRFIANLLGAQQGLTDTERNIFLNQWTSITGQPLLNQANLSQGVQAKGSL